MKSRYNDPAVLKAMGYNGKVYSLFESPVLAVDWNAVEPGLFDGDSEAIVDLGRESGSVICDHYAAWMKQEFPAVQPTHSYQGIVCRYTDTLHLNAQGHLAMFRELAPHFGIPKHFTYEEAI